MNISPEQVDQIIERAAQILADKIEAELGGMADMVVLPLATASSILALTPKQIPIYLPLTKTSEGKHGVTLGAIRRHIESRTEPAKGITARKISIKKNPKAA